MKLTRLFLLIMLLPVLACQFSKAPAAAPPAGTVLFQDDFSSPASGWDRTQLDQGVMDYDGGGYRMLVNASHVNIWSTPKKDFSSVRLEVDAGKLAGPDENRLGLICRFTGDSYYFFIISSDGYYGIGLFTGNEAVLLGQSAMRPSGKINQGTAINHLRADCRGDALSLYVNNAPIAEIHDSTLTHGDVGLLAGAFNQPGVDVVFDNFVATAP